MSKCVRAEVKVRSGEDGSRLWACGGRPFRRAHHRPPSNAITLLPHPSRRPRPSLAHFAFSLRIAFWSCVGSWIEDECVYECRREQGDGGRPDGQPIPCAILCAHERRRPDNGSGVYSRGTIGKLYRGPSRGRCSVKWSACRRRTDGRRGVELNSRPPFLLGPTRRPATYPTHLSRRTALYTSPTRSLAFSSAVRAGVVGRAKDGADVGAPLGDNLVELDTHPRTTKVCHTISHTSCRRQGPRSAQSLVRAHVVQSERCPREEGGRRTSRR